MENNYNMQSPQELTLAYSPCPNDTFLFYHLVHSSLSSKIKIKEELHDVEHLNLSAHRGIYDITKLSFFAFFSILDKYILLNTGSALGRGCGPLLVKKKGKSISNYSGQRILVPGMLTTANLLLNIYLQKNFTPISTRYDLISDLILSEEYGLGVIIHEERFTFEEKGLEMVVDLGQFWEEYSGLPIPLGAIAVKRSIPESIQEEFDSSLYISLQKAYENPSVLSSYILQNSQVKDEEVVKKHIDLYVNDFTKDIGVDGKASVLRLYSEAKKLGLVPNHWDSVEEKNLFRIK
jgi:1,4-dihydroxy-6-naphthoate synthase